MLKRLAGSVGARHLELSVEDPHVERGGEVVVTVRVKRPVAAVEVGLVCHEHYEVLTSTAETTDVRAKRKAVAHADWHRLEPADSPQTVRLAVPADAPFTYRGRCVSYVWQAVAREPRRGRRDPSVAEPLVVWP